jgi:hypothetical protein
MEGLDLLGATDAFADQYITFRIKNIDPDKLRQAVGSAAESALTIANTAPKAALDLVVPIVKNKIKDYGVDAEIVVSKVPPSKGGRAFSEFWVGALAGTVLGLTSLGIYKGLAGLVRK